MPYSSEHKTRTRARIVESARKLFNRHGFEQVSIDRIMSEAGLTRGGFYHHFDSKDELYVEAIHSFSTCNPFKPNVSDYTPAELARRLVDVYLSDEVLDSADFHCPLYALPSDVARAGLSPQKAYTQLINNLIWVYSRALEGAPDREERAQAIVALCVGAMVVARTTHDTGLRGSVRATARQQALALLDAGPGHRGAS
jgi:TetR/AcrR family transcriptional regulator, transcriptional repressor for nem operon